MALVYIETRTKNLPDSGAWQIHKFGTAAGEQRIALEGNWEIDPTVFDFFVKDVEFYFFTKSDMLDYINSIQEEIYYPTQHYRCKDYPSFYADKIEEINMYPEDFIILRFEKNPRAGGTAYIASVTNEDSDRYNFLRSICLSSSKQGKNNAYTTFHFVKYQDTTTGKYFINLVPIFSKQYSMEELSTILAREVSLSDDIHVIVNLFGLKYAESIIANNYDCESIIKKAKLDEDLVAELETIIDVYKELKNGKITINPIANKKGMIGEYLSIHPIKSTTETLSIALQQNFSDYRPYITAIKSKPFLLLAGISGTGKSRIVRELARACWEVGSKEYEDPKPSNFEMVQVKPNWHDSSELIGYVSRVSGEPVYVAGPFLKFVAKAWENPDVPYFLCLDEMNLAPVEQYFAEYLSVIESRKAEDGVVKTDPILDKVPQQWYFDLVGSLTEIGEVQDRFKKDGICIPQNLIVVGTVNMDETTFSFSRKVLDRAMTIEMNEVNLTCGLDKRHETIGKLDKSHLIGTAVEGCDVYNAYKADCDTAITYLNVVNQHLEKTPFKVAYRTRNEFLLYVVNNLPYNKDKDGNDVQHGWLLARALDEITCMKVLPRIEGDETKVSKEFLSKLKGEIKSQLEKLGECTYTAIRAEENKENNVWYSKSLDKLDEMTKRLESGYTSFWS